MVPRLPAYRTPEIAAKYPLITAADHLMRMSVRAFLYMNKAFQNGDIVMDVRVPDNHPFKRVAKVIEMHVVLVCGFSVRL